MKAKFAGTCRECRKPFAKGDDVIWLGKGEGCTHFDCKTQTKRKKKSEPWEYQDINWKHRANRGVRLRH